MACQFSISTELFAEKKKLLCSDDFVRAWLGKGQGWAIVVPRVPLGTAR